MPESRELAAARVCLADAEARLESAEGLTRLIEGLGRLTDVLEAGNRAEARTAGNLAASYAGRCYERIRNELEQDAQMPEPKLEHYFKLVLAFDQVAGALPPSAGELKVAVVEALVDRYYEGHPPEKKRVVLEQLAALKPDR